MSDLLLVAMERHVHGMAINVMWSMGGGGPEAPGAVPLLGAYLSMSGTYAPGVLQVRLIVAHDS